MKNDSKQNIRREAAAVAAIQHKMKNKETWLAIVRNEGKMEIDSY